MRRVVRHFLAAAAAVVVLAAGLTGSLVGEPPAAQAADPSDFNPGNIISDAVFFNPNTMSVGQIQKFLDSKVPNCRVGYTCLTNYRQNTPNKPKDPMCSGYTGAKNESAATIIYKVAKACNINPQVILVTLQKEQGFITDTWPSARMYRSAMGYGCPDTADCDVNYYGFFNQVYAGTWAFQRYTMPKGTGPGTEWYSVYRQYAPGKTARVLYHPNSSCGTKAVKIENEATSSLYTYTPYTPNRAALNAGYGVGDGCSAYGNRNFYNYFTDWFGGTQLNAGMVRAKGTPEVYIVSGNIKHHVPTKQIQQLYSALGPTEIVSKAYLDTVPRGVELSAASRDPRTGVVALLENGKRHRFVSCDQVAVWGYACGNYINLSPRQAQLLPMGAELTPFFRVEGDSTIYKLDGTTAHPVDGAAYAATLNGGTMPFLGTMRPSAAAALKKGGLLMSPAVASGTMIKRTDRKEVYFVDDSRKIHLPNWGVGDALGRSTFISPSSSRVDAYPTASSALTQVVTCGGETYFGADGSMQRIDPANEHGLGVTELAAPTCENLNLSSEAPVKAIWVKTASAPEVYEAIDGERRWVPDRATWIARGGEGTLPRVFVIGARQMTSIPLGTPLPRQG